MHITMRTRNFTRFSLQFSKHNIDTSKLQVYRPTFLRKRSSDYFFTDEVDVLVWFEMKPMVQVVSVIGLIILIVGGFLIIMQPIPPSFTELYWEVEVGDTLQYEIRNWGVYNPLQQAYLDVYLMNNTSILATITVLPSISEISNIQSFTSDLIHKIKVNCAFTNGSQLNDTQNSTLCSIISGCILPLGAWSMIDSLFPDELGGWSPGSKYDSAKLFEDHFTISYMWCGSIDASGGWSGNVSLTTGVPFSIRWSYNHGGSSIGIQLSLIEH